MVRNHMQSLQQILCFWNHEPLSFWQTMITKETQARPELVSMWTCTTLNFNENVLTYCVGPLQVKALILSDRSTPATEAVSLLYALACQWARQELIPVVRESPHGLITSCSLTPEHYSWGSCISAGIGQDKRILTISYIARKLILLILGNFD